MNTTFIANSRRRGSMATEVVVASVLLLSGIAFLSSLVHRVHGVLQTSRQYHLGTQLLTNQIESITVSQIDIDNMGSITLPSDLVDRLPDATLTSRLIDDDDGRRILLQLVWGKPSVHRIEMVGWLNPLPNLQAKEDAP